MGKTSNQYRAALTRKTLTYDQVMVELIGEVCDELKKINNNLDKIAKVQESKK